MEWYFLLESAESLASRLERQIPVYTDFRRMLDRGKPEALLVCLPPGAHRGEIEEAARRGIHLFLEKPLAVKVDEAEVMVKAAKAAGVITQVDFQHRFHPLITRLHELRSTGEAGIPSLLQGAYLCNSLHVSWWRGRSLTSSLSGR